MKFFILGLFLWLPLAYAPDEVYDPYKILDVARNADASQIEKAYRLRLKAYPNGVPKEMSDAYQNLRDPQKRAAIDISLPKQEKARDEKVSSEQTRANLIFEFNLGPKHTDEIKKNLLNMIRKEWAYALAKGEVQAARYNSNPETIRRQAINYLASDDHFAEVLKLAVDLTPVFLKKQPTQQEIQQLLKKINYSRYENVNLDGFQIREISGLPEAILECNNYLFNHPQFFSEEEFVNRLRNWFFSSEEIKKDYVKSWVNAYETHFKKSPNALWNALHTEEIKAFYEKRMIEAMTGIVPGDKILDSVIQNLVLGENEKTRQNFSRQAEILLPAIRELMEADPLARDKMKGFGRFPNFVLSFFSPTARCQRAFSKVAKAAQDEKPKKPLAP